jgi:hypothetical protein
MTSRSKCRPLKRSSTLSISGHPCPANSHTRNYAALARFAPEPLHEEFKRRIKTQTVLPCAETAAMLFWALLASGQITMRKVNGWHTLAEKPADQIIDLAA